METSNRTKSIWWREPMVWLVLTLPMLAVVAALTSVWIAYRHAPNVYPSYYDQGTNVIAAKDMDTRAHSLSLSANFKVTGDSMLSVLLNGKKPIKPQNLVLKMAGPSKSDAASRVVLSLKQDHTGKYSTTLPPMATGQYKLVLEPIDRAWRLVGIWEAPFSGTLRLVAKSVSDSSMLP